MREFYKIWIFVVIFIAMPFNGVLMYNGDVVLGILLSLCHVPFLLDYAKNLKGEEL